MSVTERHPPVRGEVRCSQQSAAFLIKTGGLVTMSGCHTAGDGDWRLEKLIDRLPPRLRQMLRSLRQPSRRGLRIFAGLLLIIGGILAFLPILGAWMLPLGLALLAEDVPVLRSLRSRVLDWVERRHPTWLQS
jgi:hypothetical protein